MPEGTPSPGDRLIRSGIVVTAVGMALTMVAILPLVTDLELPSAFWWLAMITGLGLAMVVAGLARNGRRRSRTQVAATAADVD